MVDTPNYGYNTPTVGGDDDAWGNKLNANWTKIDTDLKALADQLAAAEQAITNLQIKVGDLYISTDAADPATKLGYGTWEAYGAGRAIVGVGTADGQAWITGQELGANTHTLADTELPAHTHDVGTLALSTDGSYTHDFTRTGAVSPDQGGSGGSNAELTTDTTQAAGDHTHTISGATASTGGGGAHNNIQPSIGTYIWKRTA